MMVSVYSPCSRSITYSGRNFEEEHRRQRDHKKLQGQLIAEQEALYGSKPSPSKPLGGKKAPRMSTGGAATNRRLSLGAGMHQTPKPNKKTDQRQIDGALSTGRRGLDVAGLPSRKQSMNPCEQLQSPLVRKPFSPLPTTVVASKANIATPQQLLPTPKSNVVNEISAFATPVKNNNSVRNLEEEKMQMMMMQTPKNVGAMIPIPSTPATISVPMQTAATPLNNTNARLLQEKAEVVEYSFEERRLAFMLQSESLIHV
ncbi:65-kDa microtubule-associated protein 3 [Brassica rapa]|uniref:65-kDa microtubule-associated protein 3 n=1 Tax=Brassica campestris TaxID=3711 RepID=UPI0004F1C119|nr:65-kDa microtubule-associated protein 3 [Brassica rapa]XP_033144748.1 65-kDa microtubule-associated protein 3 [Brassica rapa]XP_033144749.1 65-kDa microtubule-associated protein 3 [Brassica rapa]XP_033144750.1 65-kDa microtubule-associated protein 3 [Brassica rapa]